MRLNVDVSHAMCMTFESPDLHVIECSVHELA